MKSRSPLIVMVLGLLAATAATLAYFGPQKDASGEWYVGKDLIASVVVRHHKLTLSLTNTGMSGIIVEQDIFTPDFLKERLLMVTFGDDDPTGTGVNSRRYKLSGNGVPGMGSQSFKVGWRTMAPGEKIETQLDLVDAIKHVWGNDQLQAAIAKPEFAYRVLVRLDNTAIKGLPDGEIQYSTRWIRGTNNAQ
jgi:hypothetical protein